MIPAETTPGIRVGWGGDEGEWLRSKFMCDIFDTL
jgi:hypothetical protein